jgi:hypothetical protein
VAGSVAIVKKPWVRGFQRGAQRANVPAVAEKIVTTFPSTRLPIICSGAVADDKWVPTVKEREIDVVSSRLHNYEYHPTWGFLADQSWLRAGSRLVVVLHPQSADDRARSASRLRLRGVSTL